MTQSRRDFLKSGALGVAGIGLASRSALAHTTEREHITGYSVGDPAFRDAALTAIDAAKSAGATYADVRVGQRDFLRLGVIGRKMLGFRRLETHDIGIRVLVNGTWGFAHATELAKDNVALTAKRAVEQARINSFGSKWQIEMAPTPPVPNGEWNMKVEIDPFNVSLQDQVNLLLAAADAVYRVKGAGNPFILMSWAREDRIFASSEGSMIAQRFYTAMPEGMGEIGGASQDLEKFVSFQLPVFPEPAAAGYEVLLKANLQDSIMLAAENMMRSINAKSVDPGRYELVVDAHQLAKPLHDTLSVSLELDRALGYEANAEGTSYLAPPKDKLTATKPFTSAQLTLRGNRKEPGAAARGWDDEGVAPEEFTLIEKGMLKDYHTTREMAMTLDWWYKQQGKPTRSHGCATSYTAEMAPISTVPNVTMDPAETDVSIDDLVKTVKKGILVVNGGYGWSDQQGTGGQYYGEICQEIRNGKLIGYVKDCSYRFVSGPFWKNLLGLGGKSTYRMTGIRAWKGQPFQNMFSSVGAVAAHFKEVNIENTGREL